MQACLEFAQAGRLPVLATVYTQHQEELGPHLLRLLRAIPETTDPRGYAHLLPKPRRVTVSTGEGEGGGWEDIPLDLGGVEEPEDEQERELVAWYCARAREFDDKAGQLAHALAFADLGLGALHDCGEHTLLPLRALGHHAKELAQIVYGPQCGSDLVSVTLGEW